jgi:hypothetical protein
VKVHSTRERAAGSVILNERRVRGTDESAEVNCIDKDLRLVTEIKVGVGDGSATVSSTLLEYGLVRKQPLL